MIRIAVGCFAGLLPAAEASPVLPVPSGSSYVFALPAGGPRLEVDSSAGARISSLGLGASEVLYLNKGRPFWGSSFLPSPQDAWPDFSGPLTLDREAYTGGPQGSALVMKSAKDAGTQLVFVKRFSANESDTSFSITLVIRNAGSGPKSWAPWQITRVPPGGFAFFPKGPGGIRGNLSSQAKEMSGWLWFDLVQAALPAGSAKFFADGEGWMAHVDRNGLLLLEIFPDIPAAQAAPGEGEVEIFADPKKLYMEVEHQGAYAVIQAGDSTAWTTRWYLRRLPDGIPRAAGDPALMAYVSSLARRAVATRLLRPVRRARVTQAPGRTRPRAAYPVPGADPVDAAGCRLP
jgi:hypothetical protein